MQMHYTFFYFIIIFIIDQYHNLNNRGTFIYIINILNLKNLKLNKNIWIVGVLNVQRCNEHVTISPQGAQFVVYHSLRKSLITECT